MASEQISQLTPKKLTPGFSLPLLLQFSISFLPPFFLPSFLLLSNSFSATHVSVRSCESVTQCVTTTERDRHTSAVQTSGTAHT